MREILTSGSVGGLAEQSPILPEHRRTRIRRFKLAHQPRDPGDGKRSAVWRQKMRPASSLNQSTLLILVVWASFTWSNEAIAAAPRPS